MKIKVCHVLSDVDQSHLIETHGEIMDKNKYEIGFVFLGKKSLSFSIFFKSKNYFVEFFEFTGAKTELPKAVSKLRKIFRRFQPDIVHTHLVEASLTGLTAAATLGIRRRVHTRHHGVEAHVYYPRGVYYDKIINRLSVKIIAISQVVKDALINLEKVAASKVATIPHGFDLKNFAADEDRVRALKDKYGLNGHHPIIGSIARFIHWKGVQNTIPAFRIILEKHPQAKLVLANATGPYKEEIHRLLKENLNGKNYVVIEFEPDVFALYQTFDAFVHVPVNRDSEAFGQVFVEALAMKVPSVFTLAGITNDFIVDRENALVVPFDDAEAIAESLETILSDERLRRKIVARGRADVLKMFDQKRFGEQLDHVYTGLMR